MMFFNLVIACTLFAVVSAAAGWYSGSNVNTVLGVAAGAKSTEVFAAGYSNTDGGVLWYSGDRSNGEPTSTFKVGGINLSVAVSNDNSKVCVVGPSGIFYGNAGDDFTPNTATGPWETLVTQNVRSFGTKGFAVVGRFKGEGTVNGVAVAADGPDGTWTLHSIGLSLDQGYYARYGSFPSTNTWYVTSGNWPHQSDDKLTNGIVERVSARISVYYNVGDNTPQITFLSARNLLGTYPGAISKTTDGGATWTKVFDSNGQFAINQIDCFDEQNCYATGENGKKAVIVKTTDGGANWSNVMTLDGPKSLSAVRMISATEVWVSGGEPSSGPYASKEIVGNYFHTSDGGATWDKTSFNGYGYDLTFKNGNGYAAALFKKHTDIWFYQ
eukprot:gene12089-13218_t